MDHKKEFLGTEPIGKLLLRLAIPTVIAQLINLLYNIVDRIYIGHMPENGAAALTGVGVCLPLLMIVAAFSYLVSSGGAPRASIAMGKRDVPLAEQILGGCFTLLIGIALVLTAVLLIFCRPLLLAFGASGATIEYAAAYMQIYAIGTIFVQITLGLNAFITAQGFTRVSMLTVLIGAVSNIILDPIFIFALGLGVRGAALATILSQAISAIWCLRFLSGEKTMLRLRPEYFFVSPKIILPCVALGTATFIMVSSESVITVCFNASLLKYGGDLAVGAMTICTTVVQFTIVPMQGIGQGAQPIAGYNFGAGNADRVRRTFRVQLLTNLVYACIVWGLIMLMPRTFASIFTTDAALLDYASRAVRIYCGAMLLMAVQNACQLTFVATGNTVCSILVAVVRKFVLLLPMIYLLPALLPDKATAVYLAEPISDVLAISFTAILFAIRFPKSLASLKPREDIYSTDSVRAP